jgi:hypothetical protein
MSDKRERFKRVATRRTNAVLKKLQVLGNCANRNTYEYTEEEANKIFSEIERELKLTRMKFQFAGNSKRAEFRL